MPVFPDEIELIIEGADGGIEIPRAVRVYIDGEELPWYTTNGVRLVQERGTVPAVTITIPAGRVKLTHKPHEEP